MATINTQTTSSTTRAVRLSISGLTTGVLALASLICLLLYSASSERNSYNMFNINLTEHTETRNKNTTVKIVSGRYCETTLKIVSGSYCETTIKIVSGSYCETT